MRACLQAALQTLQGLQAESQAKQAWSQPAAFILEVLAMLPDTVKKPLAKQVLLEPFSKVPFHPCCTSSLNLNSFWQSISAEFGLHVIVGVTESR